MAELAEQKRAEYATHARVFHRPKAGARETQELFFGALVEDGEKVTLVHETDDGHVDAFLIATLFPAPPVYDPGGLTCSVDDFTVESPELWETAGVALLEAAIEQTRPRGAVQTVVVCGPRDQPKRDMLFAMGHQVASEWFTLPFEQP